MAQNYPKRIEMKEGIDLLLSHAERMGTDFSLPGTGEREHSAL